LFLKAALVVSATVSLGFLLTAVLVVYLDFLLMAVLVVTAGCLPVASLMAVLLAFSMAVLVVFDSLFCLLISFSTPSAVQWDV
jgi:hypothetical protein